MSWHYCVYVLVRFRYTGKDQVLPWNSGFGHQQHGWCPDFSSKKKSCRHKHSWHLSPSLLLKISRVVISLFCCIFFLFIYFFKDWKYSQPFVLFVHISSTLYVSAKTRYLSAKFLTHFCQKWMDSMWLSDHVRIENLYANIRLLQGRVL